jgi:hypothetical protein
VALSKVRLLVSLPPSWAQEARLLLVGLAPHWRRRLQALGDLLAQWRRNGLPAGATVRDSDTVSGRVRAGSRRLPRTLPRGCGWRVQSWWIRPTRGPRPARGLSGVISFSKRSNIRETRPSGQLTWMWASARLDREGRVRSSGGYPTVRASQITIAGSPALCIGTALGVRETVMVAATWILRGWGAGAMPVSLAPAPSTGPVARGFGRC